MYAYFVQTLCVLRTSNPHPPEYCVTRGGVTLIYVLDTLSVYFKHKIYLPYSVALYHDGKVQLHVKREES